MQFHTNRRLLIVPAALGTTVVLVGGAILGTRAAAGRLAWDVDTSGAATLLLLGGFFLIVAWRLHHYRLEATAKGLAIAVRARGPSGLIPWGEITRLERVMGPDGGATAYLVVAGKRRVTFTSQLFPRHAELASLIAEHTGLAWEAPAENATK